MHAGFSPPPLWLPQNVITPEQVRHHHRNKHRGGKGGQALSLPSSYICLFFTTLKKEILKPLIFGNHKFIFPLKGIDNHINSISSESES
jgi:hypothetical protein